MLQCFRRMKCTLALNFAGYLYVLKNTAFCSRNECFPTFVITTKPNWAERLRMTSKQRRKLENISPLTQGLISTCVVAGHLVLDWPTRQLATLFHCGRYPICLPYVPNCEMQVDIGEGQYIILWVRWQDSIQRYINEMIKHLRMLIVLPSRQTRSRWGTLTTDYPADFLWFCSQKDFVW